MHRPALKISYSRSSMPLAGSPSAVTPPAKSRRQSIGLKVLNELAQQSASHSLSRSPGRHVHVAPYMLRQTGRGRLLWDLVTTTIVFAEAALLLFVSMMSHRCQKDVLCHADAEGSALARLRAPNFQHKTVPDDPLRPPSPALGGLSSLMTVCSLPASQIIWYTRYNSARDGSSLS